jgi:ATP-binding cassette subfamily B protein
MKEGNIVESGNHQDLLEQKSEYYNLWNKQNLL